MPPHYSHEIGPTRPVRAFARNWRDRAYTQANPHLNSCLSLIPLCQRQPPPGFTPSFNVCVCVCVYPTSSCLCLAFSFSPSLSLTHSNQGTHPFSHQQPSTLFLPIFSFSLSLSLSLRTAFFSSSTRFRLPRLVFLFLIFLASRAVVGPTMSSMVY